MKLLIVKMRKILLIIMLAVWTLWAAQAENAAGGYSAYIQSFVQNPGEAVLSNEEIAHIEQEISTVFLQALQKTARFGTVEISHIEGDLSGYSLDTMVVKLIISHVLIETDPESGKKIFRADAAAESYNSDQQEKDLTSIDFNLLGIGETFDELLQSAAANLRYSVMSIVRMFPLPGSDLAVYDIYNNYPIVIFSEKPSPLIGDEYKLVSGTGDVLGLAEISRLIPLKEGEGTAAELEIMYTDVSLVPGIAVQPSGRSPVKMQSTVSLSLGAVGTDITISGTKGEGFFPKAGVGALWILDNPYPVGSFFVQQNNTITALVSGGFAYRVNPGKNLSKPGNLFLRRICIDAAASFVGGFLFDLTTPSENNWICGSRISAGISWYLSDYIEISAKCRYDRLYPLQGSSDPLLSTISGAAGVTFRL
ncbi:MAG: hypothetical protein ISR78_07035 [Spirochaetia bacterium]|nr:hypothetical protein [Spirochaetia bacterium]